MSKGISKLQRRIIEVLGKGPCRCYTAGPKITREITEELIQSGHLDGERPQKQLMATVVRACRSLFVRGMVSGKYTKDDERWGPDTIMWSLVNEKGAAADKSKGR